MVKKDNKPENYRQPWLLEDIIVVANTLPTAQNRAILANALKRTEAAIDYLWYNLYRSKKSWRMEYPEGFEKNEYVQNVLKARKIVGLTRVFTPIDNN